MSFSKLGNLPDEVLFHIFQFCDIQSLGRLTSTCKRFKVLIDSEDSLWKISSKDVFGSNMTDPAMINRCKPILSFKERCHISTKWKNGSGSEKIVLTFRKWRSNQQVLDITGTSFRLRGCMPWIVLERDHLYCSERDGMIVCTRDENGNISRKVFKKSISRFDDISRFSINGSEIVCGIRNGTISRWRKSDLSHICSVEGHSSDVLCVDYKDTTILSGSQNGDVKIWKARQDDIVCGKTIDLHKRILCTAIMPSNQHFIVGSPGVFEITPLDLFDLERGEFVSRFGDKFRIGAGIMDVYPESETTFLACGYDTTVRLWDIRAPDRCAMEWMDAYDNVIYCVSSDRNRTITTGACRHSLFHIWDKRNTSHCVIYRGVSNSPVYSIAFDASHIFAASDRSMQQVSFI